MITLFSRILSEKSATRLFYILIVSLMAFFSILLYFSTGNQEFDGVRINLAGRQRMLSQKLAKDILLYKINKISARDIMMTVGVYDKTLQSLTRGGWAQPDLTMESFRKIPAMKPGPARDALVSLGAFWRPFRVHIERFIEKGDTGSMNYIIANNESLLQETDRMVMMLQELSEKNNLRTQIIIIAAIALVLLVLGANLAMKMVQLKKAKTQIAELEKLLPICSNCKRIRGKGMDPGRQSSWISVEEYLRDERDIMFTHGLCPVCAEKLYPDFFHEGPSGETIK